MGHELCGVYVVPSVVLLICRLKLSLKGPSFCFPRPGAKETVLNQVSHLMFVLCMNERNSLCGLGHTIYSPISGITIGCVVPCLCSCFMFILFHARKLQVRLL